MGEGTPGLDKGDKKASALIIRLMEQNARDAAYTTNALLDGYRADAQEARATIAAIQFEITALFEGPYAPNPLRVLRALYPSRERVAQFMKREES